MNKIGQEKRPEHGAVQVVITDALRPAFDDWLGSNGLNLFRIPVETDLDTYGVGITDERWAELNTEESERS